LLPLGVVLTAVVLIFGLMGWIQLNLTIATTASLPILLGLGVDYMVQFHNRYEEELSKGQGVDVLRAALGHIGPAVGIAVVATILGFLTLLISPVPMVRDFAKVLAGGVLVAYGASMFVLTSILVLRDRRHSRSPRRLPVGDRHFVDRGLTWLSATVIPHPLPILAAAVLISAAGWTADRHISTQTDIEKMVPQQMSALTQIHEIRAVTGGTTQLDVMVTAPDVTRPVILNWMTQYENAALKRHPDLISVNSPVVLLAALGGSQLPGPAIKQLLANSPAVLRNLVLTPDLHHATIIFTIQQQSMDYQVKLIDQLQAEANPPAGVTAELTGTAVVAAKTVSVLSDNRLQITLLGVGVVFLGLLVLYRRPRRALLVVFPMILVIGWSSGAMFLLGEPWNPLTVTLGALIIGIGAEFTILLIERYSEESAAGREPAAAMGIAMHRIGRAIVTSGLMVMAGFSALIASDFPALRAFGIVVAADMAGILIATLVVLPPLVVGIETWRGSRVSRRAS
jgi:hydrophobe/amphiphile efflux-3 (HAE3) family protein